MSTMSANFKAKLADINEVQKVYDFVKKYPLDYPNYFDWLEKCRRELELGYKKAFYVMDQQGNVIGSIIFQPHKQEKTTLELKNLRVDSAYYRHGIGSQLVNLAETYAKDNGFDKIQSDAHLDSPVLAFMLRRNYQIAAKTALYTTSIEAIISKKL